jgi:hypothetical protein
MSEQKSAEYYKSLDDRLRLLLPQLQESVGLESWRWCEEWIRAGEYGLAVEYAAEGLNARDHVPLSLASDLLSVAKVMKLDSEPVLTLRARVEAAAKQ